MRFWIIALMLALGACGPLVQIGGGSTPPASLFTLRADAAVPAAGAPGAARRTIVVDTPGVPALLRTLRVPVTVADTRIAYLKQASWIEPPARQVQRLLVDVLAARPGLRVFDADAFNGAAERRLAGTLIEFGLDVRDAVSPRVTMRFDAVLLDANGALVATRRFDESRAVASEQPNDVADAMNAAANAMAGRIADWTAAS